MSDNHSIQFPVLSLTGILISTCISVINALGVYWQHRQWKVPESNRPHGLLAHLTVIASLRYTFPCDGLLPTLPSFMCVEPLWKGKSPGNNQWEREELNLHCLPRGNRFTVCRNTANRYRFPRMESLTVLHPPSHADEPISYQS